METEQLIHRLVASCDIWICHCFAHQIASFSAVVRLDKIALRRIAIEVAGTHTEILNEQFWVVVSEDIQDALALHVVAVLLAALSSAEAERAAILLALAE